MNDPDLYLVRVWHGDRGFRASLRRVDEEEAHVFHSAEGVARFLAGTKNGEPRADEGDPAMGDPHGARR